MSFLRGDRVRLKDDAPLRQQHPELAGIVGVVSSTMGGRDLKMHVRFATVNVVALDVDAGQFEPADAIEPVKPDKSTTRLKVV